jgi:hypothetical protein
VKAVFADAVYWIAIVKPGDPWKASAERARAVLGPARIVTSDEVLTEFLTALSNGGDILRQKAAQMVRAILANANVKVVPNRASRFFRSGAFRASTRQGV